MHPRRDVGRISRAEYQALLQAGLAVAVLSVAGVGVVAMKSAFWISTLTADAIALPTTGQQRSTPTRRRIMNEQEPPSARSHSKSSLFFIGKNSRGNWVVQDQQHLSGGLFIDRAAALRFALFENGNQPQSVIMVPGVLELDLNSSPRITQRPQTPADASRERQAA